MSLSLPRVSPSLALLPLRLFLGATFVYGGVQKLSDPGFLHPGAPTYIGAQLRAFASGTPGGFLLRAFALPAPKLAGVGVALLETAVGLLVLGGLLTRVAAIAGLVLNLILFLTNSWNTSPYFLGSDIVFVFAWLPLVLAGAAGQPALDHVLGRARERRSRVGERQRAEPSARRPSDVTRRAALGRALGAAGVATLAIDGLSALLKGRYAGPERVLAGSPAAPRARPAASAGAHRRPPHASTLPAGARSVGPANRLPRGQAALYRDPGDGGADIVVRHPDGSLTAHSAVCTHAGCNVTYQQGALYCPCHGSVFNAHTGAVEQGPAVQPLPARRVIERGGLIYSVPA